MTPQNSSLASAMLVHVPEMRRCAARSGFSLIELITVVAVMGLIAMIVLPMLAKKNRHKNYNETKCVNNLRNVGLALRIFATDNEDRFPAQVFAGYGTNVTSITALDVFKSLSNELSTPKIVQCPSDRERADFSGRPVGFSTVVSTNFSYFINLTASEELPNTFLAGDRNWLTNGRPVASLLELTTNVPVTWSKQIHNEQGNIVMSDGSVQTMSSSRLRSAVRGQEWATNYITFP